MRLEHLLSGCLDCYFKYLHNIDERLVRVFSVVQPRLYENGKDVFSEHSCKMIKSGQVYSLKEQIAQSYSSVG